MSESQKNTDILDRTGKVNLCNRFNPFTSAILTIYDSCTERSRSVNGKLMQQNDLISIMGIKSINVSSLKAGVYILKLDSKSQEFIVK